MLYRSAAGLVVGLLLLTGCSSAAAQTTASTNALLLLLARDQLSPNSTRLRVTQDYVTNPNSTVLASLRYDRSLATTGWDVLSFEAAPGLVASSTNGTDAYYAVGYLEGYATCDRIWAHYFNSITSVQQSLSSAMRAFLTEQLAFLRTLKNVNDPFQSTVMRLVSQFDGMVDGYQSGIADWKAGTGALSWNLTDRAGPAQPLLAFDMFVMATINDVGTIIQKFNAESQQQRAEPSSLSRRFQRLTALLATVNGNPPFSDLTAEQVQDMYIERAAGHCSALVKWIPGDDIYVAHNTWDILTFMIRQYKSYFFGDRFGSVSMTSIPGQLHSSDDWIVTGASGTVRRHNLFVMETSINVLNSTSLVDIRSRTVPSAFRTMAASYTANNGAEWTRLFLTNNSGTYNNQWMILDVAAIFADPQNQYSLVDPTKPSASGVKVQIKRLPDGAFTVSEQAPGNRSVTADLTPVLRLSRSWASFNVPYFANVSKLLGWDDAARERGTMYTLNSPRGRMFARDTSTVVGLSSLQRLFRYNDYLIDPLSAIPNCSTMSGGNCSPRNSSMLSIAARGDLAPLDNGRLGLAPGLVKQQILSTTDAKVTTVGLVRRLLTNVFQQPPTIISYGNASQFVAGNAERPFLSRAANDSGAVVAVNGPPTSGGKLPTFEWSKSPWASMGVPALMPNRWVFDWVNVFVARPVFPAVASALPNPDDGMTLAAKLFTVAMVVGGIVVIGGLAVLSDVVAGSRANRLLQRTQQRKTVPLV